MAKKFRERKLKWYRHVNRREGPKEGMCYEGCQMQLISEKIIVQEDRRKTCVVDIESVGVKDGGHNGRKQMMG